VIAPPPDIPDDVDLDPLADGIPDQFADAERQLGPVVAELLDAGAAQVILPLLVVALLLLLGGLIRRQLFAPPNSPSAGPPAAAAALVCVGLYVVGRGLDPLLASLLRRPEWFPEELWANVGWFEWKLLGRPWIWGALPLSDHPALAILVHVVVWGVVWVAVRAVLEWIWSADLRWNSPDRDLGHLPWYFPWVGSSTTRRADRRFRRWLGRIVMVLLPVHTLAGMHLSENVGALPAPGAWVTGGLLLWTTAFHLLTSGRPPAPEKSKKDEKEAEADQATDPRVAPLARLREAVERLRPGVQLEALEQRSGVADRQAEFPATISPLVRELFEQLTGAQKPWTHQAELLEHLAELWRMQAAAERGEVPTLAEEHAPTVVSQARGSTNHALVLAPEGSGRTTLTLLAALHVYFDRGATSLIIVRDRAAASRWAETLERALQGSSARWNVLVCQAGEDLGTALIAERTPAIIVADLESCESEVLCDTRTDNFLGRLGLIVADDVDAFCGVAEMHLQLCARRLWALLDRLHEAPYPVALLATAGVGASGMDAWAKHVLAVPMRLFSDDGAATRSRVLLRRRDLVDAAGGDIPLATLAAACDLAELPWHLRLAGDGNRTVRRAAFDLGNLRRHHRDDPREAAIVIVEGSYADVRREADRLAHVGMDLDRERFPEHSPVVLVLAPPGDEEMVLHEEADDAVNRDLVAALPRAVPLAEPRVVRQRHFDRAVGREQDLRALRDRFGGPFVDETVARLGDALRLREVLHIDPQTDDILPRTLLRSAKEGALGQPIDAACVSDRASRTPVVDAGTSELLLTIDAAVAKAVYPPGRVFLHPRGRFMVVDESRAREGTAARVAEIAAEQIDGFERTTLDRSLGLDLGRDAGELAWTERQLGGRSLPVTLTHAQVIERVHGVRRFAPGPTLVDHRIYDQPIEVRYGTDVCLLATAHSGVVPEIEVLIPLCAALRMVLPSYLRAASELVDVDIAAIPGEGGERRVLCVFDRTPGGSGFARHVCERGLRDLLSLARMVLERCVGPEFVRLRHIHDRAPASDPARWRVGAALSWLDAILDAPRPLESSQSDPVLAGPRVEFVPGEGIGDLGRLWITRTGRTDDLVWTRHTWWSAVPLAGQPRGTVFFDIAVERPAIAAARRRALEIVAGFGGSSRRDDRYVARVDRLDLDSRDVHRQLVLAERRDLEPIHAKLAELCGDALTQTVLALVAGVPISPRPLTISERSPLAVLARRHADVDAKLLLACALLPPTTAPAIVRGPDGEAWLRVDPGAGAQVETWSLDGPRPVLVDAELARRGTVILAE
jgi:hypothetical protein